MRMQGEKGTVIGEKSMKNEEYKKLSIKEFTKAAGRYESNHAGIYEMCKKDYPDILEELEKEPFRDLLDAGCGPAPMVSYDGFDPNEKTEFYSMEDECEKIEQEIRTKYGGRIKAAYGCSLGGSFVSLLIQRKRIHIDHGIIGSSDMDESRKKLIDGFVNMFGIDKGGSPWITKQSVYNQFYSDLVTKVQHGIDVPGTTIHVFYATKMGEKYEKRYCTYFKNPDIRRHNMQHEELFCCHSAEWVKEVKKAVEGDRQ